MKRIIIRPQNQFPRRNIHEWNFAITLLAMWIYLNRAVSPFFFFLSFFFFFFFNSIPLKSPRNFVSSPLLKLVCENLTIASSGKLRMQLLSKRIRSSTRRASASDAVRLRDLIYCEPRHYEPSCGFVSVYDNFVWL